MTKEGNFWCIRICKYFPGKWGYGEILKISEIQTPIESYLIF